MQLTIPLRLVLPLLLLLPLLIDGDVDGDTDGDPPPPEISLPATASRDHGIAPEAIESLVDRIQTWVAQERIIGGELLMIKDRRTLLHRAFGWNDREEEREMQPHTLFNIRSMTKPLVGAAIQILIEEGRLAPEDPVARYLPAFQQGGAAKITVEQLLAHRGGLPLHLAFDRESPPRTLREWTAAIGEAGPEFDPGTRFWYSDAGADVLGGLIEAVSGETLDTFLESRIFRPLGMKDSGFHTRTSRRKLPTDRMAVLYGGTTGAWQRFWGPTESPLYSFPQGSQSVYTTPLDYARFLTLWLDGGPHRGTPLLSEESIRRTLTPLSPMQRIGSSAPYLTAFPGLEVWHGQMALLWRHAGERDDAAPEIVGYAGSDGTFAWAWPREDLIVLFFTQSRGQNVHLELEATLHQLLVDGSSRGEADARSGNLSSIEAFQPYLGRYRADFDSHEGTDFTVLVQGDRLAVDIPGQMVFLLDEPDRDRWRSFTLTDQIAVLFRENAAGKVEGMRLAQTSSFPKQSSPDSPPETVPEPLLPLLGTYRLVPHRVLLEITWADGVLSMTDPAGEVTPLAESGTPRTWMTVEHLPRPISFLLDPDGTPDGDVVAMELTEIVDLPKVD
jgi:CubicO group peptidase (beta-lactamase class C family)